MPPTPSRASCRFALKLAGQNETFAVSYCTEAGLFQDGGAPAHHLRPGDIAQAHTVNEFVRIEELEKCHLPRPPGRLGRGVRLLGPLRGAGLEAHFQLCSQRGATMLDLIIRGGEVVTPQGWCGAIWASGVRPSRRSRRPARWPTRTQHASSMRRARSSCPAASIRTCTWPTLYDAGWQDPLHAGARQSRHGGALRRHYHAD